MFHYIDGGADDEWTLAQNTRAFDRYELVPRYLRDVGQVDLSTRVLGFDLDLPIYCSPTAMNRLFDHRGELAVAEAAQDAGTLYSLSSIGSVTIKDVAEVCAGPKMFQIYVFRDRTLNDELLAACREHGYGAACLTVDVPVAGNRERDYVTGMTTPPKLTPRSLLSFALHQGWTLNYLLRERFELPNIAKYLKEGSAAHSSVLQYLDTHLKRSIDWDDAAQMIEEWGGPFAIKGVMSVDDARRSVDVGASAIMVSNHGGRQLDGSRSPFDQLDAIVDAVGGQIEIILDGGVRRGTHVLKALAKGATACSGGRLYLYALAAA